MHTKLLYKGHSNLSYNLVEWQIKEAKTNAEVDSMANVQELTQISPSYSATRMHSCSFYKYDTREVKWIRA